MRLKKDDLLQATQEISDQIKGTTQADSQEDPRFRPQDPREFEELPTGQKTIFPTPFVGLPVRMASSYTLTAAGLEEALGAVEKQKGGKVVDWQINCTDNGRGIQFSLAVTLQSAKTGMKMPYHVTLRRV
jgi:hypothetical protein